MTVEIINTLIQLLPGLVYGQFYYYLSGISDVSATKRIIDTVIYTFVLTMTTGLFVNWEQIIQVKTTEKILSNITLTDNQGLLITTLLLICFLPIIQATLVHHDLYHRILRRLKLTTKSSRKDTWNDTFISEQRHVIVYLKDGRRIRGYPERFSEDPEEGLIYLRNPAWVNDTDSEEDYIELYTHGMLLQRENIDMIEFTLNNEGK